MSKLNDPIEMKNEYSEISFKIIESFQSIQLKLLEHIHNSFIAEIFSYESQILHSLIYVKIK